MLQAMPSKFTLDQLAQMVQSGFEQVAVEMNERFLQVDRRLDMIESRVGALEFEVRDLRSSFESFIKIL